MEVSTSPDVLRNQADKLLAYKRATTQIRSWVCENNCYEYAFGRNIYENTGALVRLRMRCIESFKSLAYFLLNHVD